MRWWRHMRVDAMTAALLCYHLPTMYIIKVLWRISFQNQKCSSHRNYRTDGYLSTLPHGGQGVRCFVFFCCWLGWYPLRWRHDGRDSVSNHQPHDCLLSRLFRRRSKKTSNLRVTGLCVGNSPGTGEFPAQMASNAENVSIWWRHHAKGDKYMSNVVFSFHRWDFSSTPLCNFEVGKEIR